MSTLRRFLDRTPLAAALVGPAGEIIATNAHMEALLGFPPGGFDGMGSLSLLHPDDAERATSMLVEALEQRRPTGIRDRFRLRTFDGDWRVVEIATVNLLDDPAMNGILVTATAVEAPEDARVAWFEAVLRQIGDVVQVLDAEGRVLYLSSTLYELTGATPEQVLGRKLWELVHDDPPLAEDLRRWIERLAVKPGRRATGHARSVGSDGETRDIEVHGANLLDDALVQGLILVSRDVTARRRAEADARLAARLLEASPVAIAATDANGVITAWNAAAEKSLGWSAEEAIGTNMADLGEHTAESFAGIADNLPLLQQGATVELRLELARRDGTTFPAYVSVVGLLDGDGAFAGMLTMGLDLSTEHAVREALARTEGRWSALAREAREVVTIVDADGTVLYAGPGYETLLGYEPDSLTGTSIRELLHPEDRLRPGGLDEVVAGRATGYQRDYRVRHADGSWRVFEVEVSDRRDEPWIGGFVIIGRDVTRRVRVERTHHALAEAMDSSGAAVLVVGLDGRVTAWNRGAEQLLGWPAEEAIGSTPPIVPGDERATDAVERGETRTFDAVALRRDGTTVHLSVNGSPLTDPAGEITASSWVAFDVTAQRTADREREEHAAQQAVIAAVSGRALAGEPIDDVLAEACRLASSTLGSASVTTDLHEPPGDGELPAGTVVFGIEGWDGPVGTLTVVTDDERTLDDGDLAFVRALANVLGTVVDRSRVSDEMRRRALHDDLTDLPNRTLLVDRLEQAISRSDRRGENLAVLFVDLDRFKRVNDTLGHGAGDAVLVETGHRLIDSVRAGDTVARVGGDEFVVLCEDVADSDEAVAMAQRIVASIEAPMEVDGAEVTITASVGVVVAEDTPTPDSLVRDADLAMYRAKQRGRARVEVFDAALRREAVSRRGIERALHQAVVDERLRVVFQPQVDLRSARVVGAEALVRWDDPEMGPVEPAALVDVAEEMGLLDRISWFVLREACSAAALLRRERPGVAVAVNLGGRQVCHPGLVARVGAAVEEAGVSPDALVIEVLETDVVDDAATRVLTELRAQGVRVSLDDFGTGWSSLHRLTRLPVDEVKIDRSFVSRVGQDRGCDAVVRAVTSLAAELSLRVVAEGVERIDQRDRLIELGCHIGQGFLLGEAVEAERLVLPRHTP